MIPLRFGRAARAVGVALLAGCMSAGAAAQSDSESDSGANAESESPLGYSPVKCWFKPPASLRAECGALRVREDRENPDNKRTAQIPVLRLFGPVRDSGNPPAVILGGGGPGGQVFIGRAQEAAFWDKFRRDVLGENGELILAEQRGAGLALPSLICPTETDPAELLAQPLSLKEEARILREDLALCAERLAPRTDLLAHTTAASADDFAELRRALGVEQWDLMGFSYGSRVAFELLARDPGGARAAVMDAVVPPRRDPKWESQSVSRILDALAAECAADSHCAARGDLRANLDAAAARLEKTPALMRARDPRDGKSITVAMSRRRFADFVFLNLYEEQSAARLPKLAAQFARGETQSAEATFFMNSYLEFVLDEGFADALYLSIVCRESPRPPPRPGARFPEDELTAARRELFAACDDFFADARPAPPPPPEEAFSRVPVLMLAGEYDVAAPPEWARNAADRMKNARATVFPTAHISMLTIPCARQTVREFLKDPDAPLNQCAKQARRITFH